MTAARSDPGEIKNEQAVDGAEALRALEPIKIIDATPKFRYSSTEIRRHLPSPTTQRKNDSLTDVAANLDFASNVTLQGSCHDSPSPTIFYLAYGSNLSAETFQGRRGIRPITQLNVLVPALDLTFDLAGVPYAEPCFANTKYRSQEPAAADHEKYPLLPRYHKLRWHKGLVGVVYEVTREDFARIIATEGGGASYQDILVDCYELPLGENTVPTGVTSLPFKAHTLFSPSVLPGSDQPSNTRRSRPDPNFAQPSRRYLKLITDGAEEHNLPEEYRVYLRQLRPYVATTKRQKIGGALFMMTWFPLMGVIFGLVKLFADKRGRSPAWLTDRLNTLFAASWRSYDLVFKRTFGDGERTVGDDEGD